ncbi:uncharacterized protein VTP21DRAFT_6939 [Calcarisporiella thermophila]|uniref:uncharacterized protein n=1 Tax=Calcarisporiella thermophila TaxID=911321 RepID=UPI00374252BA
MPSAYTMHPLPTNSLHHPSPPGPSLPINALPSSTTLKQMLDAAHSKAHMAVLLDQANKLSEAIDVYREAVEILKHLLEMTNSSNRRKKLKHIHDTYQSRIHVLMSALEPQKYHQEPLEQPGFAQEQPPEPVPNTTKTAAADEPPSSQTSPHNFHDEASKSDDDPPGTRALPATTISNSKPSPRNVAFPSLLGYLQSEEPIVRRARIKQPEEDSDYEREHRSMRSHESDSEDNDEDSDTSFTAGDITDSSAKGAASPAMAVPPLPKTKALRSSLSLMSLRERTTPLSDKPTAEQPPTPPHPKSPQPFPSLHPRKQSSMSSIKASSKQTWINSSSSSLESFDEQNPPRTTEEVPGLAKKSSPSISRKQPPPLTLGLPSRRPTLSPLHSAKSTSPGTPRELRSFSAGTADFPRSSVHGSLSNVSTPGPMTPQFFQIPLTASPSGTGSDYFSFSPTLPGPDPSEAPPTDPIKRIFWLMRNLDRSMRSGAHLTAKMYIPRGVWLQQGTKLGQLDAKVQVCEALSEALTKFAQSKYLEDNSILLRELDAIEPALVSAQSMLAKKLGLRWNTSPSPNSGSKLMLMGNSSTLSLTSAGASTTGSSTHSATFSSSGVSVETSGSLRGKKKNQAASIMAWSSKISRSIGNVRQQADETAYVDTLMRLFTLAQSLEKAWLRVEEGDFVRAQQQSLIISKLQHWCQVLGDGVCGFVIRDLQILIGKWIKKSA